MLLENDFRNKDEEEYFTLAQNIVEYQAFSYDGITLTAYRPPGYPLFLAMLSYLSNELIFLRLVNYLAHIFTAFLVFKFLKKNISLEISVIGLIIYSVYPLFLYSASTLYPQTIGTILFLLTIYWIFERGKNKYYNILSGILFGVLILFIPSFILIAPVVLIFLFYYKSKSLFKSPILFLVSVLFIISLWSIRNFYTFDSLILVSSNSGINLLLGNSNNTKPNSGVSVDISKYIEEAKDFDEIDKDRYYKNKALEWIKQNPGSAITLYFQKVANYFNFKTNLATTKNKSVFYDILLFITYYPLIIIVIFQLLYFQKYKLSRIELFFLIIYIVNAFTSAIFFTRIRFRIPFDAILILLAVIFLDKIITQNRYLNHLKNSQSI